MLFLLFRLGGDRYALDARDVIAVLPRLAVRAIPHAERGVVGLCNYHDQVVPVIDLGELALNCACEDSLSSRIVLVRYPAANGETHVLGLLAESVTRTLRCEPSAFVASRVTVDNAPYLGAVTTDEHGFIQRIEVHRLLPPSLRSSLFKHAEAAEVA